MLIEHSISGITITLPEIKPPRFDRPGVADPTFSITIIENA